MSEKKTTKDFWGPPIWTSIHIFALFVNSGNAKQYEEFLWVLTRLLPCDYCRANLAKKLREFDPELYLSDGRHDIAFFYSYAIHDLANQHITEHTEIARNSPSFDHVLEEYTVKLDQDGVNFWGPPIWSMIHILAATYRSCDSIYYNRMLSLLPTLLPDNASRKSLSRFLQSNPVKPHLLSNDDLFYYTYTLHDSVNRVLSKTSPAYIAIKSFYFSSLGEMCNDCN